MTTGTLAKLAEFNRYFTSANSVDVGPRVSVPTAEWRDLRTRLLAHIDAQALPAAGRCDECGKDQAEGWALYCVGCLGKTGLLAKEALPNAQHVSSTAADLTGPNDTAEQALPAAEHTLWDQQWYWVSYEGLGRNYHAAAMYKANVDCFYSYEFSGIPAREITVEKDLV